MRSATDPSLTIGPPTLSLGSDRKPRSDRHHQFETNQREAFRDSSLRRLDILLLLKWLGFRESLPPDVRFESVGGSMAFIVGIIFSFRLSVLGVSGSAKRPTSRRPANTPARVSFVNVRPVDDDDEIFPPRTNATPALAQPCSALALVGRGRCRCLLDSTARDSVPLILILDVIISSDLLMCRDIVC